MKSLREFYRHLYPTELERITGVNPKQLWHYASGMLRPRFDQAVHIEAILHWLGEELLSIGQ